MSPPGRPKGAFRSAQHEATPVSLVVMTPVVSAHPGHELLLGGTRSGKSRCAESRAATWLQQPGHQALLLATALAGDDEMQARIERHRSDRAERVPALQTREVPHDLPAAVREASTPQRLLVVDCLTLWLTQALMPLQSVPLQHGPLQRQPLDAAGWLQQQDALCQALRDAPGPVVLVSNEISLGVAPLGREVRQFLDALGWLHQRVAAECSRVTLMVAGLELRVKPCA
jgi:adenosylcobinamide kinase/adenosylcobinamide-phosphate guanylyltransferase